MSLQADLIERIKELPTHKQLLVKSFVDELSRRGRAQHEGPPRPWFGCLEYLDISITEDDIAEARHEMWGKFAREVR